MKLLGAAVAIAMAIALAPQRPALAADAAATSRPMVFDHLDISRGLSQGTVTKVMQDRDGFLWIATESGLNRFDGIDVQRFVHERDTPGALANDYIWDLDQDAEGRLWLATNGGGVAVLEPATATFTHYRFSADEPNTPASDAVRSIEVDGNGIVWIGLRDAGLNRLDPATGTFTRFDNPNPSVHIPDDATVFDIIESRRGALWFATSAGLYRYVDGERSMRRYRHRADDPESLSDDTVITVHESADGTVWAGTYEGGLNALAPDSGRVRRYRASAGDARALPSDYVRDVLEDDGGRLWVATTAGLGLLDRETDRFTTYTSAREEPQSLGSSYVMSLYQDRGGVLWVGTRGAGVASWNPRSWSLGLSRIAELDGHLIVAFAEDDAGHLWIGTIGKGLQRLTLASGELVPASELYGDALSSERTMALLFDRKRRLWVGTMTSGLHVIDVDSGRVSRFAHDPDDPATLANNGIMSLHEDRDGRLWVGTFGGGLHWIDADATTVARVQANDPVARTLSQARVTAIAEDASGTIWAATDGDGLFAYEPARNRVRQFVTAADDAATISANRLYALHYDIAGNRLYVGTAGRGLDSLALDRVDAGFSNVSMANGLPDNVIYGIQPGPERGLWLSTNSGLTRYDLRDGATRAFHTRHGLQGEEFNFGAHHRGPGGRLYFGGAGGFNAFLPAEVNAENGAPRVVLTRVEIDNAAYAPPTALSGLGHIDVSHEGSVITFQVAVPDFVDAEKARISYWLEGFDADWSRPDTVRRIAYTNLDAGNYVLRVRAISSAGVVGETSLSLPVRVSSAPWATLWAKAAYGLLSLLAFVLAVRWYRRKLARDAEIERLSSSDALTGLANRDRFMRIVSRAIQNADGETGEVSVLAIDFNHIKRVNDSFGHSAGDRALMALANQLMHTVAGTCQGLRLSEVARLNGDEFAIVLAGRRASRRAERLGGYIVSRFSEATVNGDDRMALHTNVGIAHHPAHGGDAGALVRNALAAVHAARGDGGTRCLVYSGDIAARLRGRLTLERDLRRAVSAEEFEMYLQPKFDVRRQTLTGAEALLRWRHPERGIVAPGEFIAVAEEVGLIQDIGRWMIRAAARQIHDWQQRDMPVVPIAVNLSAVEFRNADPIGQIAAVTAEFGIDPALLHVELTESVIMQDSERTRGAMESLRDMGCGLSIDDFGTGYSSLAYLRRFPIDTLKIDRAFVRDLTTSDEDRSICNAIVAMAHGLNLRVIAEGVETEAQLRCLGALGCDEVQGYLLGRPVPCERFAALFGARAAQEGTPEPVPFITAN